MSRSGIIGLNTYFLILTLLLLYHLAVLWPRLTPANTSQPVTTTQPTTAPSLGAPATVVTEEITYRDRATVYFFWAPGGVVIYNEARLLLIVMLAGALGALLHAIRSFYWYVGNRLLKWSWANQYVLLPLSGTILALIFYLVIRGGFFAPTSTVQDTSPFGFAALAALIGMFSREAVQKLKQLAENILAKAEQGKDAAVPGPGVHRVAPSSGPAAGGTLVTITGQDFMRGATVTFGGALASNVFVLSRTSITAATPAHAAGAVDVIVANPDQQSATLAGGFTYTGGRSPGPAGGGGFAGGGEPDGGGGPADRTGSPEYGPQGAGMQGPAAAPASGGPSPAPPTPPREGLGGMPAPTDTPPARSDGPDGGGGEGAGTGPGFGTDEGTDTGTASESLLPLQTGTSGPGGEVPAAGTVGGQLPSGTADAGVTPWEPCSAEAGEVPMTWVVLEPPRPPATPPGNVQVVVLPLNGSASERHAGPTAG